MTEIWSYLGICIGVVCLHKLRIKVRCSRLVKIDNRSCHLLSIWEHILRHNYLRKLIAVLMHGMLLHIVMALVSLNYGDPRLRCARSGPCRIHRSLVPSRTTRRLSRHWLPCVRIPSLLGLHRDVHCKKSILIFQFLQFI